MNTCKQHCTLRNSHYVHRIFFSFFFLEEVGSEDFLGHDKT